MPGHYVPDGGLSCTACNRGVVPRRETGHWGSKMAEFISRGRAASNLLPQGLDGAH